MSEQASIRVACDKRLPDFLDTNINHVKLIADPSRDLEMSYRNLNCPFNVFRRFRPESRNVVIKQFAYWNVRNHLVKQNTFFFDGPRCFKDQPKSVEIHLKRQVARFM